MAFNLVGKAVRRIRLPIVDYNAAPITIIPVQEGDVNSRYFEISLYDDSGDIDLSIYSRAILSGVTPSGITLYSTKCEIAKDGKSATVLFGGGFTAQAGRVACNITFTNGEEPTALTSQTFYVIVSESQLGKIVTENEDEYNVFLSWVKELDELENKLSMGESQRVGAEIERANSEADRASAENDRVSAESKREQDCQAAVQNANDAAQDVRELLTSLPCAINAIDGETATQIIALNFVSLQD